MNVQEMSFWELALEVIDDERRMNVLAAEAEELKAKAEPVREALQNQIKKHMERGELEPGRYSWGSEFIIVNEHGGFSVIPQPNSKSVMELPGYREWSEECERRAAERKAAKAENGEG